MSGGSENISLEAFTSDSPLLRGEGLGVSLMGRDFYIEDQVFVNRRRTVYLQQTIILNCKLTKKSLMNAPHSKAVCSALISYGGSEIISKPAPGRSSGRCSSPVT